MSGVCVCFVCACFFAHVFQKGSLAPCAIFAQQTAHSHRKSRTHAQNARPTMARTRAPPPEHGPQTKRQKLDADAAAALALAEEEEKAAMDLELQKNDHE